MEKITIKIEKAFSVIFAGLAGPSQICLPGKELLQSPFRTEFTWDHVRGDIADPCGVIADPSGVIADPYGVVAIPEAVGAWLPIRRRRSLRDSLNIIKHC